MKKALFIFLVFAISGCARDHYQSSNISPPSAADDDILVVVDSSMDAYTVVVSIPAEKREEAEATQEDSLYFYTPDEFARSVESILKPRILEDAYPKKDFYRNLSRLVLGYQGVPFGVTWHGGIAITYNDYMHAARMYEIWRADPATYRETQNLPANIPIDPTNPNSHFIPLLRELDRHR